MFLTEHDITMHHKFNISGSVRWYCGIRRWQKNDNACLLKYNSLFSSWSQSFRRCVRDWRREGDKDRPLYWPITSSLDHTMVFYFQDPSKHFCFSAGSYSTGGRCEPSTIARHCQWLQAGSDSRLTLTPIDPGHHAASSYTTSYAHDFR